MFSSYSFSFVVAVRNTIMSPNGKRARLCLPNHPEVSKPTRIHAKPGPDRGGEEPGGSCPGRSGTWLGERGESRAEYLHGFFDYIRAGLYFFKKRQDLFA